jgi:D-alanyl-lipoteichoic acid acyltransferase DltB (MBOAT superfamily)
MLFNSFQFILFYILVVCVLFALPQRFRWMWLLAASTYFYMCWRPSYVVFLIVLIVVDYFCGIGMGRTGSRNVQRVLLGVSLASNLGLLFVFKYFNFFSLTLTKVFERPFPLLHLILPIGISFHVFQSLAYTIDVYRGRQEVEHQFGLFALFVMFFPQLVAGPIERPQHLLHQFHEYKPFTYNNFRSGMQLTLWGMIKKVCIADLVASPVTIVYSHPSNYSGPVLLLATLYFTVQIYCDFSGYTDIARGVAKIMGYDLVVNFRQPYFSRSIKEFWQRWHISLSTWFRDYVYYPLGGSRVSRGIILRNLAVVFLVSGLWHGAAWTFVVWGALHGMYMIIGESTREFRGRLVDRLGIGDSVWYRVAQVLVTLNLVMIGWVFFRANSVANAWYILKHMYIPARVSFFDITYAVGLEQFQTVLVFLMVVLLIVVDYILVYRPRFADSWWRVRPARWAAYITAAYSLIFFGIWEQLEFIYFQF